MFQKDRPAVTALELDDLLDTRQSYSTARAEAETQFEPLSHDFMPTTKSRPGATSWQMVGICAGLFVTTVLSVLLLTASCSGWTVPDNIYWFNIAHRASIQLVVQILSNALALVYSSAICMLINYASRIYWDKNGPVRMDMLRFWRDMCSLRMDFDIPLSLMILLVGFIGLTSVQSALWAGALTLVATTVLRETNITVPSYHNTSLIAEYASEVGADAPPDVRGTKGYFTYKVGVGLTGELLRAAASATPTGDEPRKHQKNDNTQFTYIGRSYGVGSSVGLLDDTTPSDTLALALTYQEVGYDASVSCAYNASADFVLEALGSGYIDAFAAKGELPNSVPGDPEYSTYVGWGARSVVAIGVGRDANSTRHTLGIAAGEAYAHLNATQCDISFAPALFDVAVSLRGRNISVTRAGTDNNSDAVVQAWDTGNLRYVLTRQFELLANAQTNLYVSLVGSSLNSSIADYVTASGGGVGVGLEEATPPGLANAVAVMTDDMLVAYAQAQLMVGGFVEGAPAVVQRQAMRVGEDAYVYAVFVLNVVVILAVLVECLRTRGWRGLVLFDYMDVAWLAVGGFRGGLIANGVDNDDDVVGNVSPEEWNRLDVSLESAAGDSFIRITKRSGG